MYHRGMGIPQGHYFYNMFVSFAGTLERCSRRDAMDRLFFECGGIPMDRLGSAVRHLVIGRMAESTDIYKEANAAEARGYLTILTEQEFFDALDGKFIPPENPNKKTGGIVYTPTTPGWKEKEEQRERDYYAGKRAEYIYRRNPAGNIYDVRLQDELCLCFTDSQVDTMWEALDRWGEAAQVGCAVEECAELIVALQKHTNRTPTPETLDNIQDEIADVEIMLAQMRMAFGVSDAMLAKRIATKLAKLDKSLKRKT